MKVSIIIRVQLGGVNFHQKQCKDIPDTISKNHDTYMTSCYKKFTLILSSLSKERVTPKSLEDRRFL